MFSGYQEWDEYEDELYAEEEHDGDSEPDSELEFQLYSQLHYCTDDVEDHPENRVENQGSAGHETPQEPRRVRNPSALPGEVILIDSGPDVITVSDNTEEEDSVCARKGQRSKGKGVAPVSHPQVHYQNEAISEEVVVLDSESDQSSDSEPYVVDPDLGSGSDSDRLESWMILGREKEEGDQDIQLNIFTVRKRDQPGECVFVWVGVWVCLLNITSRSVVNAERRKRVCFFETACLSPETLCRKTRLHVKCRQILQQENVSVCVLCRANLHVSVYT